MSQQSNIPGKLKDWEHPNLIFASIVGGVLMGALTGNVLLPHTFTTGPYQPYLTASLIFLFILSLTGIVAVFDSILPN